MFSTPLNLIVLWNCIHNYRHHGGMLKQGRIAEQFKVTEYSPARSPRYSSQSNSQKKLEVVQQPRKPLLKIHKIGKRSQSVVKERERDRSPNRNTIVRRVERTLRRESTKDLLETESEASSMTEQMLAGARLDDAAAAAG